MTLELVIEKANYNTLADSCVQATENYQKLWIDEATKFLHHSKRLPRRRSNNPSQISRQTGPDVCPLFARDQTKEATIDTFEVWFLSPFGSLDSESNLKAQQTHDTIFGYEKRIQFLKTQAEYDGYSLNGDSQDAFWVFFKQNPFLKRGCLVLMENGNLRVVWKGENGSHIGLQFLNSNLIQFVIFARRDPLAPISRVVGRDTMEGIKRQIDAFDLSGMLYP